MANLINYWKLIYDFNKRKDTYYSTDHLPMSWYCYMYLRKKYTSAEGYKIMTYCFHCKVQPSWKRSSWSWSYGSWNYNYRVNQCKFESRSGEVYSIQHYVIKFVSDLGQVGDFLRLLRFPPSMKPTSPIQLNYYCQWR
jgi:hypothetical protein